MPERFSRFRREATRVIQIALGDCGPGRGPAPVFDGYTSRLDLSPHERTLDPIRIRLMGQLQEGVTSLLAARTSLDFIGSIFHERAKRRNKHGDLTKALR